MLHQVGLLSLKQGDVVLIERGKVIFHPIGVGLLAFLIAHGLNGEAIRQRGRSASAASHMTKMT